MAELTKFSLQARNMIAEHIAKTSGKCTYCFNPQMPGFDVCYKCKEHPFRESNEIDNINNLKR